jgi:RTA1 like protein
MLTKKLALYAPWAKRCSSYFVSFSPPLLSLSSPSLSFPSLFPSSLTLPHHDLLFDNMEDVTITFVIVRSIYRLVENLGGYHNHIATNERVFYSCDTVMLLLFVLTWNLFHPSRLDICAPETAGAVRPAKVEEGGVPERQQ